MSPQTGLPDYVRDHFEYVIKAGPGPRMGQAIFFGSSLLLPLSLAAVLAIWPVPFAAWLKAGLLGLVAIFGISMIWYLVWMQSRLQKFRIGRPESYARWYGLHRRRSFGGWDIGGQLKMARLQLRYVFSGREPTEAETLDLTMRLSRF